MKSPPVDGRNGHRVVGGADHQGSGGIGGRIRLTNNNNPEVSRNTAFSVGGRHRVGVLRSERNWENFLHSIPSLHRYFLWVSGPLVPLLPLRHQFFAIILLGSTTLLTWMTGISLRMQWPLPSQSHGSFSQWEQLFFCYMYIKLHALIRLGVSPPSYDTGAWNGVLCGSQQNH
jgi:hypothetical protein